MIALEAHTADGRALRPCNDDCILSQAETCGCICRGTLHGVGHDQVIPRLTQTVFIADPDATTSPIPIPPRPVSWLTAVKLDAQKTGIIITSPINTISTP